MVLEMGVDDAVVKPLGECDWIDTHQGKIAGIEVDAEVLRTDILE